MARAQGDRRAARRGRACGAAVLLAAVLALAACERTPGGAGRAGVAADPGGGARSRVYLDEAGRPVVPAPGHELEPPGEDAALGQRVAPTPRVEPAPGGGEMILLHGRLRHAQMAQRAPDGRVSIGCERKRDDGR